MYRLGPRRNRSHSVALMVLTWARDLLIVWAERIGRRFHIEGDMQRRSRPFGAGTALPTSLSMAP